MRTGLNPAKQSGTEAYQPHALGILTITYIPFQTGFYRDSLEIFKIHAASVRQYTSEPFNYMVFDNGSCPEVKQTLQDMQKEGLIDWLFLSEYNVGKTGALNMCLPGFPHEWICYTDSDMLFRPGWLEASRKIYASYPNLGMVGAQVIFPDWEVDKGNTQFRQTQDPQYVFSQFTADDWIVDEYCLARGISDAKKAIFKGMQLDKVLNTTNEVEAVLGGNSHQQWLAPKEAILKILPLPSKYQLARNQTTYQDIKMDELGYLHLTTTVPYLYHMGNMIDPEILPEIEKLTALQTGSAIAAPPPPLNKVRKILTWMSKKQRIRPWMMRIYNVLYQVLSN